MDKHSSLPRSVLGLALLTGLLLLVPLVAMRFTGEVRWTGFDFFAAATLLFGAGLVYLLAARRLRTGRQRLAAAVVILAAWVLVWLELAVGLFR